MNIQVFDFALNFWFVLSLCLLFLIFGLLMARGGGARSRL